VVGVILMEIACNVLRLKLLKSNLLCYLFLSCICLRFTSHFAQVLGNKIN